MAEQKADSRVLERRIQHRFAHPELLETALTHSSFANEQKPQQVQYNERLEFLGDSVLSIVVSQYIFTHYTMLPEGEQYLGRSLPVVLKGYNAKVQGYIVLYVGIEFGVLTLLEMMELYAESTGEAREKLEIVFGKI